MFRNDGRLEMKGVLRHLGMIGIQRLLVRSLTVTFHDYFCELEIFFSVKELRGSLYENDRKFQLASEEGITTAQV